VFVKEAVPRRAIAWLARAVYNENYVALPMRHAVAASNGTIRTAYEWYHAARWHALRVEAEGAPSLPADDCEETFITEHYWGYARQRDGGTVEYRVEHPRWSVWRATAATLDCDVARFYGPTFAPFVCGRPRSAFIAYGSPIVVRRGVRLTESKGMRA